MFGRKMTKQVLRQPSVLLLQTVLTWFELITLCHLFVMVLFSMMLKPQTTAVME